MIDKQLLQKRFSKQASIYDAHANVQKQMAKQLLKMASAYLHEQAALRILEIGSGTGYVTAALLQAFPNASITTVDLAPGMIRFAEERLGFPDRVHFVCADAEVMDFPAEHYDCIISNAAFQWFNEPKYTIQKLERALRPSGVLVFATFGPRTFYELHQSHVKACMQLDKLMNSTRLGPTFLSIADWQGYLHAKQVEVESKATQFVEYFPTAAAFLHAVKKIGANNRNQDQRATSPAVMRRLLYIYERDFRTSRGIPATYQAIFLACQKKSAHLPI